MKYTPELTAEIAEKYRLGVSVEELSKIYDLPDRSLIAKLSSIGVYKKKAYLNKRGERPVKKEEYIDRISKLLEIDVSLLDSLEKVTKSALVLIEKKIQALKDE